MVKFIYGIILLALLGVIVFEYLKSRNRQKKIEEANEELSNLQNDLTAIGVKEKVVATKGKVIERELALKKKEEQLENRK